MGGIFGKSKRCCGFPRVVYRAKGKRSPGMFCDASTWTEENHVRSARIGRTRKGPEPSAAKLVLEARESEAEEEETGAQHGEATEDAQGAEVSRQPEAKPPTEVPQHQELPEEAKQNQTGRSRGAGDAPCPAGSREDRGEPHPAQVTVEVDVHVSEEDQGGPGEGQSVPAEPELLPGAGQEAGEAGKAPWEAPVREAGDSPAAGQDSGLCPEAAETSESIPNGQGDAGAPPELQPGQGTAVPVAEGVEAQAPEAERAGEVAELCEDGHTSEEPAGTQAALQERGDIKVSGGGKAEEH